MHKQSILLGVAVAALGVAFLAAPASALVPGETSTAPFSTPGGPYEDMTVDYVGRVRGGSAVAVADRYFLTARHFSISVGNTINLYGSTYQVQEMFNAPVLAGETKAVDMRLLKVSSMITGHYDLYDGSLSAGDEAVLVGTGYTGTVNPGSTWTWSASTTRERRWGTNRYDLTTMFDTASYRSQVHRMDFTTGDTPFEVGLGSGDSGGAMLVRDDADGQWKLAGINAYISRSGGPMPPYNISYAVSVSASADWVRDTIKLLADVNTDGSADTIDIDTMYDNFGSGDDVFDLNADGAADTGDLDYMIHEVFGTEYGDFDLDGAVDGTDLAIMKAFFGTSGGYGMGNINGDAFIDGTDLALFKTYMGFLAPGAGGEDAVPEPTTLMLLGLGAAALLKRRK